MGVYMDPSYNNSLGSVGAGGQPGVASQPVFGAGVGSTRTPQQPAPAPVIASGGAPMGSVPTGNTPVGNGTGDIVLAPQKKSSRKGLIIAAIVGLLVVVGVVAGVLLMRGGGIGGTNMSAKEAFNRYANYLLYGEESDADLAINDDIEDNENDSSELRSVLVSDDNSFVSEYANRLNALWNDFIMVSDDFVIEEGYTISVYGEKVNFMIDYLDNRANVAESLVFDYAINNSEQDAKQLIGDYFEIFSGYTFSEAETYVENGKMYYDGLIENVVKMKTSGCYVGDNGSFTCPVAILNSLAEDASKYDENKSAMDQSILDLSDELGSGCIAISEWLYGGDK